jgi:hypothetical protein
MTIGSRRKRNPDWHFRYAVSVMNDNALATAARQLERAKPDLWVIDSLMAVRAEIRYRMLAQ